MNGLKMLFGLSILIVVLSTGAAIADFHDHSAEYDDHKHDHESEEHGHGHGDSTQISAEMAAAAGIGVASVGPGEIAREISVFGRLVVPPERRVSIQARFPGVIAQANVNLGEWAQKNQLLAVVDSNDSLRPYEIKAPLDGWVMHRAATVGELTTVDPLFELVDDRLLWAELQVFPSQRREVGVDQRVHLRVGEFSIEGQVAALYRASEVAPAVVARIPVVNEDRRLVAGDMVQARIVIDERKVPMVVANQALQMFEEQPVVFVRRNELYEARSLVLGSSDGRYTEVLQGLEAGEIYVVENSYLIKADLEKAGAAHEH